MQERRSRLHGRDSDNYKVTRPNASSLLRHIVRATVLDGMQWPILFSIALLSTLHYLGIAYHCSLAILIFTGLVATGMVRGCQSWQNDLYEYQRQLARARHERSAADEVHSIPGYFPSRRY